MLGPYFECQQENEKFNVAKYMSVHGTFLLRNYDNNFKTVFPLCVSVLCVLILVLFLKWYMNVISAYVRYKFGKMWAAEPLFWRPAIHSYMYRSRTRIISVQDNCTYLCNDSFKNVYFWMEFICICLYSGVFNMWM